MPLYTASLEVFSDGQIRPKRLRLSKGHLDRIADNVPWAEMESCLEWHRAPGEHSRMTAYYACADPGECGAFIVPQILGASGVKTADTPEIHYYEIEASSATATVMALVKRGMHHLSDRDIVAQICNEYWRHRMANWKFLEYLLSEYRVTRQIPPPGEEAIERAKERYTDDVIQARNFWAEK